ncbi:MAG: hypothetical protein COS43_02060 [Gallionellales bacterium CG03_land_8_20_14_0_80_55_15]|nr:MAG: hypothetical protein COS43_02060 [Gallionellales bacterium CG03_land_8_20_14_0_80_55_15]
MNIKLLFIISLLLLVNAPLAKPLGTLFYSPTARAAMVAARAGISQSAVYTLNGITQRGAGKTVAWINGRAATEDPPDLAIPTLVIKRDHVLIEGHPIKVGESLDIISGQRVLRLPEQAVQVKP